MAEGAEECDGPDMPGVSCEDANFYGGGLVACAGDCTLDYSGCDELLYEQNFTTNQLPVEVELVGVTLPFLNTEPLTTFQGNPYGACFNAAPDWCMQTADLGDGQTSGFKINLDFVAPGEVRSWVSGWTEKFDTLEVLLDGEVACEYSENFLAWQECVIVVDAAGFHQITWWYGKDGSTSEGFDMIWVDAISATNAQLP